MASKASGHTNPDQLAEELRSLALPYLASAKRVVAGPTELNRLTWETRQACFLALLAEVPGAQTAEALSALVHKRRQGRKAERALEKSGRVEDLGLLPEYCRREEDAFRENFILAVVEEMQRQQAPRGLCNVRLLLKDKGLCLQAIDFLAARHKSRTRTRTSLEHRVNSGGSSSSSSSRATTPLRHRSPSPMMPRRAGVGQTDAADRLLQFTPTHLSSNGGSSSSSSSSSSSGNNRTYLPSAHKTPFFPSSMARPPRTESNNISSSSSSSSSSSKKTSSSSNSSAGAKKSTRNPYRVENMSDFLARGLGRLHLEGEEEGEEEEEGEGGREERPPAWVMPGEGSRVKTQDDKDEEEEGEESDSSASRSSSRSSSSEGERDPEVRRPAYRPQPRASEEVQKEEETETQHSQLSHHCQQQHRPPTPPVEPSSTTSFLPPSRKTKLPMPMQKNVLPAAAAVAAVLKRAPSSSTSFSSCSSLAQKPTASTAAAAAVPALPAVKASAIPKPSAIRPNTKTTKPTAAKAIETRRPSSSSSSRSTSSSSSSTKHLNPTPPSLPRSLPPPSPPPPPADGTTESELEQQLRADNTALRLALTQQTSLQEALLLVNPPSLPASSSIDERCLRLVQHQNLQLQRHVQELKYLLQGQQEAADGLTSLLAALEQRVMALVGGGTEGGREGGRGTPEGRRGGGREGWQQALLQDVRQLQQQWRSVRRATRVSQGAQRLFLPADAMIFLKKPREGQEEGKEEGMEEEEAGLNGEWEDRARIWGVGGREGGREGGRGAVLGELDGDKVQTLQRDLRSLLGGLDKLLSKEGGREGGEHVREQARALVLAAAHLGVALPATSSSLPSPSSVLPVRPLTREREFLEGFASLLVPRLKPCELQRRVQKLQQQVVGERRGLWWGMQNAMEGGEEDEEEEEEEDEEEEEEEEGGYEYAAAAGVRSSQMTSRVTGRRVVGGQW